MAYNQRGLDEKHEQNQHYSLRDTRTLGMRLMDFMKNPKGVAIFMVGCAAISLILGYLSEIIFIAGMSAFIYCFMCKATLPFRLPKRCGRKDYNDLLPGRSGKPRIAEGIYYFGNDLKTENELWFSNTDMRTH